jgi:hypothetical protein
MKCPLCRRGFAQRLDIAEAMRLLQSTTVILWGVWIRPPQEIFDELTPDVQKAILRGGLILQHMQDAGEPETEVLMDFYGIDKDHILYSEMEKTNGKSIIVPEGP